MKKITIFVFLIFSIMFSGLICLADNMRRESVEAVFVLKNNNIIEEKFITRRDCLVSVMKIIGVTNDLGINVYPSHYFIDCNDTDIIFLNNAIAYNITNGIDKVNQYAMRFYPDRCATYQEGLTFILRCLEKNPINIKEDSLKFGILKETDEFYDNLGEYMTDEDFYVLLGRMLKQKCYIYVGNDIDNPHDKTYLEILNERYKKGIVTDSYSIVDAVRNGRIAGGTYNNLSIKYISD